MTKEMKQRRALDKEIDRIYMEQHYKPSHSGNTTRAIKRAISVALTGEKECAECTELLLTEEFYSIKENRDGFSRDCRACRSDRALESYYRTRKLKSSSRARRVTKTTDLFDFLG